MPSYDVLTYYVQTNFTPTIVQYYHWIELIQGGMGIQKANEIIFGGKEQKLSYDEARKKKDWLQAKNVELITPFHEYYPQLFFQLDEPPIYLMAMGSLGVLKNDCLSVVGSRKATVYSLQWLEEHLGAFIKAHPGAVVASGGARGIDQKAHRVSLSHHRPTIVFLPSGLGELYPKDLNSWVQPVLAAGGLFVSEYDYDVPMQKHFFERRNRLIAALASVVLIVEAQRRGGTILTAKKALDLGRSLGVVPGHPLNPQFGGSIDLLFTGAQMIRDWIDLSMFFKSSTFRRNL